MTATPSDRDILYEVATNGRWSEGEQRGEWMITKEVYETVRDALASRSLEREAEIRKEAIEECAKVADQEATALKSKIGCDPYARSRVMHVAHRIRALAQQPPAGEPAK